MYLIQQNKIEKIKKTFLFFAIVVPLHKNSRIAQLLPALFMQELIIDI